jgi:hypothetical protein
MHTYICTHTGGKQKAYAIQKLLEQNSIRDHQVEMEAMTFKELRRSGKEREKKSGDEQKQEETTDTKTAYQEPGWKWRKKLGPSSGRHSQPLPMGPSSVHIIYPLHPQPSRQGQSVIKADRAWKKGRKDTEGRQPGHTASPGLLAVVSSFALTLRWEKLAPMGHRFCGCSCALPMYAICGQNASGKRGPSKKSQTLENSGLTQPTCT